MYRNFHKTTEKINAECSTDEKQHTPHTRKWNEVELFQYLFFSVNVQEAEHITNLMNDIIYAHFKNGTQQKWRDLSQQVDHILKDYTQVPNNKKTATGVPE